MTVRSLIPSARPICLFRSPSAAFWMGGYLVMAFVIVPRLAQAPSEPLKQAALLATRVMTYSGVLTMAFGLVLIARTRGYGQLFAGEWGGIVIASAVLALLMMAIGDSALRPALRRLEPCAADWEKNAASARRWAIVALIAGILAIGFMTRAIYAR